MTRARLFKVGRLWVWLAYHPQSKPYRKWGWELFYVEHPFVPSRSRLFLQLWLAPRNTGGWL